MLKRLAAVQGKFLILLLFSNYRDAFRICDGVMRSAEKEEMVKMHVVALKREQDEIATLKTQLAEISESHKTEMENDASEKTELER